MQGHRANFASLNELLDIEYGSSSSNTAVNWSNLSDNREPDALLPPSNSSGFANDHLFDDRGYDLSDNTVFSAGQSSRSRSSPVNLDINSGFMGQGSADSPLAEPDSFKVSVSNNQWLQFTNTSEPEASAGPSGSGVNLSEENEGGPRGSSEVRRMPCKRKSFEGSSSYVQDSENVHIAGPSASLSHSSAVNGWLVASERAQLRFQLGEGGESSQSSERLPRSYHLRLQALGEDSSEPMVSPELVRSDLGLLLSQESSSSGTNAQVQPPESSGAAATTSLENTLENHPVLTSDIDSRSLGQIRSSGGGTIRIPRNFTSPSQTGASSAIQPTAPPRPMHYPRRLSEYVRRSLSSVASETGGSSSSFSSMASDPSGLSSQDVALPARYSNMSDSARRAFALRSSYWTSEAQGDEGVLGMPYSARTVGNAGEGRRRLALEIRNVLDMMRRGQGLRFEDFMILDQSVLFGVADAHDRHRDMRLDVDNMSYEELLALEERIGNVSTGLSEESISKRLKKRKCVITIDAPPETEPCCICQEEYKDEEDLGTLECGHDFHGDCIKQWLMQKNLCPICKTTGLST